MRDILYCVRDYNKGIVMKIENKSMMENWKSSQYDSKNKLNRSEVEVDTSLIRDIDKGITIEKLDEIRNDYQLPIFKYQTQITIHGVFNELEYNYVNGYKNIFQNKNKSIGVRWSAIDANKRLRIAKALKYKGMFYNCNSSSHSFMKYDFVDDAETLLNEYRGLLDCFQKSEFYGDAKIYSGSLYGSKVIVLEANINAIYENEVEKLILNFGITKEFLAEKKAEEKVEHDAKTAEYDRVNQEEDAIRKILSEKAVAEIIENGYEIKQATSIENGLGYKLDIHVWGEKFKAEHDCEDYCKFVLRRVYKDGRKKYPRMFEKTFDTFKEMVEYVDKTKIEDMKGYDDRMVRHGVKLLEFKKVAEIAEKIEYRKNVRVKSAEVKINSEKNGVEIYFQAIPAVSVRSKLKTNKWRWNGYSKCWYNRDTETNRKFAETIG